MIRRKLERLTGYWIHRVDTLPIGADLGIDIARAGMTPEVIFDVGANVGQTYERFRRYFPSARIISFEPVRRTFEKLEAKIASDPRASAECLALGDVAGTVDVGVSDDWSVLNSLAVKNYAPDIRVENLRIETLDGYCVRHSISRIGLLKIDTEGYEIPVLRGASQTQIDAVFCEVGFSRSNERNTYLIDVVELLELRGYAFHGLYDVTHYEQGSFANALFLHVTA